MSEYIVGKNPVLEALRSGRSINKIWIAENSQKGAANQVIALAKKAGVTVQIVPRKKLDQAAEGESHQGVLAYVAAYDYVELDEILHRAETSGEPPFLVLLDEIEDPHNLGSILRTADATGVHGIIIPKRRSAGLTSTVAKTSAGAIEYVPVARVTNLARTIDELKKHNIWVIGTDASGEKEFREARFDMGVALVIGSEGKGMSRLVKEKCDFTVKLPMVGRVTSLNASVASALLMYEVYRQRHPLAK
ncbi:MULTISPECIES: 23S rRNA (guanosine(2251)-2'-O)-methyltransferase RlmB [Aneurinibacillus]|uniref:23S rRNA (Guanosine(2251)-2'-O)-methyltransferase RlmB n=1 Tax=Aneurinibacillus thermoaerophilus TaxID=143495 RepID=A0A1G8CUR9_ANETH|nr:MULTISPECIES: 23S rRNA (guanosine(2251)-2'-O)-methyltransferase RlmB [Aneurinibacillus]AMA74471.1 RNA methyltransferase TrmH [Aneurinibacillus sp. XH2]MED0677294.1 23S rRNA (guanosine(2251)-2'-O)-methyltransferase RlmB [Aneurinibacillus thermoaerophilus]MED0679058.1 23S rRNA (guanosine(2251)-2'-O)-methyltransferase RlmB [Aneurinibacillus thermoaerophilus]MED0738727.1 23S rRNA (guanosine(2251)-2'-O)-methyltransferase RlmB [Aneurinibacillus thermoaerophilus]MED0757828.1 23S rRNA (guanosine(22